MTDTPTTHGQLAAITGASSGIGAATARALADAGMNVALGARRKDRLDALAKELRDKGVEALPLALDVRESKSVEAFAAAIEEGFGGLDLAFANAGTGGGDLVKEMDLETWNDVLETNVTGVFLTCKHLLALLEGRRGTRSLVITASVAGTVGVPGGSAYCASKWAVRGFAQSLALEVSGQGIRVTTINPGYVATPWHEDDDRRADMVQPEDVAKVVLDLHRLPPTAMVDDVNLWPTRMYDA